jgi:hypothetical protein
MGRPLSKRHQHPVAQSAWCSWINLNEKQHLRIILRSPQVLNIRVISSDDSKFFFPSIGTSDDSMQRLTSEVPVFRHFLSVRHVETCQLEDIQTNCGERHNCQLYDLTRRNRLSDICRRKGNGQRHFNDLVSSRYRQKRLAVKCFDISNQQIVGLQRDCPLTARNKQIFSGSRQDARCRD